MTALPAKLKTSLDYIHAERGIATN